MTSVLTVKEGENKTKYFIYNPNYDKKMHVSINNKDVSEKFATAEGQTKLNEAIRSNLGLLLEPAI